jgi:hypothetical protein
VFAAACLRDGGSGLADRRVSECLLLENALPRRPSQGCARWFHVREGLFSCRELSPNERADTVSSPFHDRRTPTMIGWDT